MGFLTANGALLWSTVGGRWSTVKRRNPYLVIWTSHTRLTGATVIVYHTEATKD